MGGLSATCGIIGMAFWVPYGLRFLLLGPLSAIGPWLVIVPGLLALVAVGAGSACLVLHRQGRIARGRSAAAVGLATGVFAFWEFAWHLAVFA